MGTIEKKILPEYFQAVFDDKKKYELRLNDFDIEEGDILLLKKWNPEKKEYTGREVERAVGYVGRFGVENLTKFWSKEEIEQKSLQIISLK
jgi:hypothetical protein